MTALHSAAVQCGTNFPLLGNYVMVKLKDRILDPIPHPSDVDYDTIRPICLPDYEADIPIRQTSDLYGKEVHYSRHLTTKKATITSHGECKSSFYNDNKGVTPKEYVSIIKHKLIHN